MIGCVLVVCEGNICRSPMAAALLQKHVGSITVESAGIHALIGKQADPTAVSLMDELGIDIRAHRARQLAAWMTAGADLVLVMDQAQQRYLQRRYAVMYGRVYRLGDFAATPEHAGNAFDIPDPYRKDRAAFEQSLSLIEAGVSGWSKRIASVLNHSVRTTTHKIVIPT
jgi:protein-tyrosine phosphatase